MTTEESIAYLESQLKEDHDLPEELWLFFSRWTPIVNVDLIIRNELNQHLLTWRNDSFYGGGWHFPGGVIRYRENWVDRILNVAEDELGIKCLHFNPTPLSVHQMFIHQKNRGHFISIPFEAFVPISTKLKDGKWFDEAPGNLLECHEVYRSILNHADQKL
jgi:colanic acid biosynthesis protein WcaH